MNRTDERKKFLTNLLITAIENDGYGWFYVEEYRHSVPLGDAYAVIEPHDNEGTTYRVDLDVIARGLGVISSAVQQEVTDYAGTSAVPHNAKTGERLNLSSRARRSILQASRDNEGNDLDVNDALAIVEIALFGKVIY